MDEKAIRGMSTDELLNWVDRTDPVVDELTTRFCFQRLQIAQLKLKYRDRRTITSREGKPAGRGDAREPAPDGSTGA